MNALTVWQVWRRILRDPSFRHDLFEVPVTDKKLARRYCLSEEGVQAATAYASVAPGVKWFVVNYRFRLVNSFLNALETGAPLTLRTLLANQIDMKHLATQFLDGVAWKDYGPNVYTYCRDVLAYVVGGGLVSLGVRDLIGLEQTVLELLLDLAYPPQVLPGAQGRTPFARLYCSETGISAWLRDKTTLGRTPLEMGREYYLVYLPEDGGAHKFVRLPERAAQLYLASNVAKNAEGVDGDERLLATLVRYRAIFPPVGVISS